MEHCSDLAQTESDLVHYKALLQTAQTRKSKIKAYMRHSRKVRAQGAGCCAGMTFLMFGFWGIKLWPILGLSGFSAILLFFWSRTGYDVKDRKGLCATNKQIRFLKKAIREYESSKAQQSNVINNAAINTK